MPVRRAGHQVGNQQTALKGNSVDRRQDGAMLPEQAEEQARAGKRDALGRWLLSGTADARRRAASLRDATRLASISATPGPPAFFGALLRADDPSHAPLRSEHRSDADWRRLSSKKPGVPRPAPGARGMADRAKSPPRGAGARREALGVRDASCSSSPLLIVPREHETHFSPDMPRSGRTRSQAKDKDLPAWPEATASLIRSGPDQASRRRACRADPLGRRG